MLSQGEYHCTQESTAFAHLVVEKHGIAGCTGLALMVSQIHECFNVVDLNFLHCCRLV